MTHILAIDQGTTSSRAILFDAEMSVVAQAQEEFTQHFPRSGWVEHEAADLWTSTAATCRAAMEKAGVRARDIAGRGHGWPRRRQRRRHHRVRLRIQMRNTG